MNFKCFSWYALFIMRSKLRTWRKNPNHRLKKSFFFKKPLGSIILFTIRTTLRTGLAWCKPCWDDVILKKRNYVYQYRYRTSSVKESIEWQYFECCIIELRSGRSRLGFEFRNRFVSLFTSLSDFVLISFLINIFIIGSLNFFVILILISVLIIFWCVWGYNL